MIPPDFPIITKGAARLGGLPKYNTGKPCRQGHLALRYTASGQCTVCCENRRRGTQAHQHGGAVPVRLLVHPEDTGTLRGFAEALAAARRL